MAEKITHNDYIEEEIADERRRLILRPLASKSCPSLQKHKCQDQDDIRYVVAHDGRGGFVTSIIDATQVVATGRKFLEVFDSEEEAKKKFPKAVFEEEVEEEELTR
jgi:hypothetical protein